MIEYILNQEVALSIIFTLLFTISDSLSDAFQIREKNSIQGDKTESLKYNKQWHNWQFLRQVTFFAVIFAYSRNIWLALICANTFWILHDGLLNKYALNKDFLFVGTTSQIDKFVRSFSNHRYVMLTFKMIPLALFVAVYLVGLFRKEKDGSLIQ